MPAPALFALVLSLSAVARQGPDERYAFVAGLAEKGMHEMVVDEARSFLEEYARDPRAVLVRYRLAEALFALEKTEDARAHFEQLARARGFELAGEARFRLGQCEIARGATGAAIEALTGVADDGPEYLRLPAGTLLAEAHFAHGDFASAAERYERVLAAAGSADAGDDDSADAGDDDSADAGDDDRYARDAARGLAWCAFRTGDYGRASSRCEAFLERWPDDESATELWFLAGESHLEADRPSEAAAAYAKVREGSFADAALRGAGFAAGALGEHARAAGSFAALLERFPGSRYADEARLHQGIHLLRAGRAQASLEPLAHDSLARDPEARYWSARALLELGRSDEALAELDLGLAADPGEELAARLLTARGDALLDLGRTDEAASAFERSGSAYALHAAAVAHLNRGDAARAEGLARQLLERPDHAYRAEASLVLAEALFTRGEWPAAEELFESLAADPDEPAHHARALARIGWCRWMAGDLSSAAERFERVARAFSESPEADEATFMAARAREASGEATPAAAAYADYLARFPDGAHAAEASLRRARFEDGPAAERRLERLVDGDVPADLRAEARFDLAERLSARGAFAEARPHYRALCDDPASPALVVPATYGLAWTEYSLGEPGAAAERLAPLLERDDLEPALELACLELAVWADCGARGLERASRTLERLIARCDDESRRWDAARRVAESLREAGSLERADAVLAHVLERTSDRDVAVAVCVERAWIALEAGRVGDAEAGLRETHRYATADSRVLEALFFVAERRFEAGEDGPAAELYGLASASEDPDLRARALYKGGFARLRAGDHEGAEAAFADLVRRHPESELVGESLFLLGEARFRAERFEQAIEPLERLRAEHPRHASLPKGLFRLGVALARTGEFERASDVLAALARARPDFEHLAEAELWRARSLAEIGERRSARAAFARVLERDKGRLAAQAHLGLGHLELAENDRDAALSEFLKVAVLYAHDEEVAEALFFAGRVLEEAGDPERARAQYAELTETHPKTRFAEDARERLRALGDA